MKRYGQASRRFKYLNPENRTRTNTRQLQINARPWGLSYSVGKSAWRHAGRPAARSNRGRPALVCAGLRRNLSNEPLANLLERFFDLFLAFFHVGFDFRPSRFGGALRVFGFLTQARNFSRAASNFAFTPAFADTLKLSILAES